MIRGIIFIYVLTLLSGCTGTAEEIAIRVDMSEQHDEGLFNPSAGDRLSLAGNMNNWEEGVIVFKDEDGDWIYEAIVKDKSFERQDTLEFKFVFTSKDNRELPNGGWESIPNRRIAISDVVTEKPVFTYNRPWSKSETHEVEFAVLMSNQEVLGFFNPEKDKVVLTGSFMNWDPNGVEMEDRDGDTIYELILPVEINRNQPEYYKYRILKENEQSFGYLPNEGWEMIDNRSITERLQRSEIEVDYFNDQMRVVRFRIGEIWLMDSLNLDIKKGDQIQISLESTEQTFLTNPLIKVEENLYETSIEIPPRMTNIKWKVLKNYQEAGDIVRSLNVNQLGKVIVFR
ncbi:MAG: hypothetical protein WD059_11350 [Balneolaceae bacterium]